MNFLLRTAMTTLVIMTIFVLVGPPPANANGIDRKMQQTLGAMTTATSPQFQMGARRGVIYGGSLQVRNKIMDASIFTYQPGHINFGCGGWDLYAGSFSFISSAQITQMLRSIASAAAAYFFKLALATISQAIESQMSELWNKMVDVNGLQLNSCKIGESLAKAAMGKSEEAAGEGKGSQILAAFGIRSDRSDAQNQGRADSSASQAGDAVPAMKDEVVTGNIVWRALNAQDASSWVLGGDRRLIEQIMSISGTVIICVPGTDGCPAAEGVNPDQEGLRTFTKGPILRLKQLVTGVTDVNGVGVYRCNDADDCLNPKVLELNSFKGTEQLILEIMLGTGPGDGLIGRYSAAQAPSSQDSAFMENGGDYVAMAMNMAVHSEPDSRAFVHRYSEVIAAEVTALVVDEMFAASSQAAASLKGGQNKEAQELILKGRQQLKEDLTEFHTQSLSYTDIYRYYLMKMGTYDTPNLPIVRAGSH